MSVWGWWAFDIFTLMASYVSPEAIAAQTCLRSIGLFTFMIPAGISSAASTLCGNSVGKENEELVKLYYRTTLFCSFTVSLFTIFVMWLFQDNFINIFTDQEGVASNMRQAWPALFLYMAFDAV
jgi:MATE family multidrug resistance protein